jgi:hypothetical protein
MTRNYGLRPTIRVTRRARTRCAAITLIGFSCFRLVNVTDRLPHEPAFSPMQLDHTRSAMNAFLARRP